MMARSPASSRWARPSLCAGDAQGHKLRNGDRVFALVKTVALYERAVAAEL